MLNWNPQGHDPIELFGKPHFDVHFDMVDMAAMQAIDPDDPQFAAKAAHLPDPKYVPQDYVVPPGPPVAAQAVPGMGVHLLDSSDSTLVPGKYNFQQIIVEGVWDQCQGEEALGCNVPFGRSAASADLGARSAQVRPPAVRVGVPRLTIR